MDIWELSPNLFISLVFTSASTSAILGFHLSRRLPSNGALTIYLLSGLLVNLWFYVLIDSLVVHDSIGLGKVSQRRLQIFWQAAWHVQRWTLFRWNSNIISIVNKTFNWWLNLLLIGLIINSKRFDLNSWCYLSHSFIRNVRRPYLILRFKSTSLINHWLFLSSSGQLCFQVLPLNVDVSVHFIKWVSSI